MKFARIFVLSAVCVLLLAGLACSSGAAKYQLTTIIEGQGSVSPGSGAFASGSVVTLTASPASGWSFSHWGGNGNGSDVILNMTMDSDKTVYAYFTNNGAEPTSTAIPSYGTLMIQSSPSGADVYIDGADTGSKTPFIGTHISARNHSVKLTYEHYKWRTESILVNAGETAYLNLSLDWAPTLDVVFQPDTGDGKDAAVYLWDSFNNYGDSYNLSTGGNTVGTIWRSFIEFNISSIPPTAVVTGAEFGLYYDWAYGKTTEGRMSLYGVYQPWDEDEISWSEQPSTSPIPWVMTAIPGYATDDFFYVDIDTSKVQEWVNGSLTNYGIMVRDYSESTAGSLRLFSSSDSPDASSHPKLTIQYYDPVGWVPPTFAETHPQEAAYMAVHDAIQDAVTAYAAENDGDLPIINAHRTVDGCTDCYIINFGVLITSNGGLLSEVPDGCYENSGTPGANDNCDGGLGATGCSPSNHYLWLVDSLGYVYSKCEGIGCASHSQSGYQEVWP
jgi:hypothetical protein